MDRIGLRELNQQTRSMLDRVRRGESLEVTDRGQPIAHLVPIPGSVSALGRAVARGRATGPVERSPFPLPAVHGDDQRELAAEIAQERERERW